MKVLTFVRNLFVLVAAAASACKLIASHGIEKAQDVFFQIIIALGVAVFTFVFVQVDSWVPRWGT